MEKSIVVSALAEGPSSISLIFTRDGRRKYLTLRERAAFLEAALNLPDEPRVFCFVLAFTGARISEVLALMPAHVDFADGLLIFESLKKRRRGHFRAVPVPAKLLVDVDAVLRVRDAQRDVARAPNHL